MSGHRHLGTITPKASRTRASLARERRVLKDTDTYKRIRDACCTIAPDGFDVDAHALVITREVFRHLGKPATGGLRSHFGGDSAEAPRKDIS